jgi:hypothetical protein
MKKGCYFAIPSLNSVFASSFHDFALGRLILLTFIVGCWAQKLFMNWRELEGSGLKIRQAVENTILSGN